MALKLYQSMNLSLENAKLTEEMHNNTKSIQVTGISSLNLMSLLPLITMTAEGRDQYTGKEHWMGISGVFQNCNKQLQPRLLEFNSSCA